MQTAAVIATLIAVIFAALWYYERTKDQDAEGGKTRGSSGSGVDSDHNDSDHNTKLR